MGFLRTREAWVIALLVVVLALPALGVTVYLEYEIAGLIRGVQHEREGLTRLLALAAFQDAASRFSLERQCRNGPAAAYGFDALFAALVDTYMSTGDQYGLTYDADFAGVSLADADAYRLPEALSQLRSARGLICTYGTVPALDQRLALKRRQVLFDKSVEDAMQDTHDAIALLAARVDVRALVPAYDAARRDSSRASRDLTAYMLADVVTAHDPAQRSLSVADRSLHALLLAEIPVVDAMLLRRLSDFERQRMIRLIPGIGGLLGAVIVAFLMVRLVYEHAALEVARRNAAEQEAMALHDGLTGIMNRRAFFSALERAVRGGTNRGLICIFDIDRFKEINDTYGHLAGDELLVRLAQTIENTVRSTDAVARLGGDEFALFLHPPIENREAERILDRITTAMKQPMSVGERVVQASVSVGVSPIAGESMNEVREALGRADAALYLAKGAARGGFRFSEDVDVTAG
ncbi:MAG: GGDEF domain-containing protein [Candidatus Eremiobacteraeota bacterium]|nr:GGDEF domain-containing protein [Candidatus Eremiobacteraeota bacterium]